MLDTFSFGVSLNLSQQKSPTAEILRIYFLRTIFRGKYMHKISTVGLFCCDKFEEIPKQKVINMSKLNKLPFNEISDFQRRRFLVIALFKKRGRPDLCRRNMHWRSFLQGVLSSFGNKHICPNIWKPNTLAVTVLLKEYDM